MRQVDLVRDGYNRIAGAYLEARRRGSPDVALLERLIGKLPHRATVLDAGCGAGVPVTSRLAEHCKVTAVDFSVAQLRLAKRLVPTAECVCQDLRSLGFMENSFDAVCSYYAIIHIPRELHVRVLSDLYRMLVPGGLALICLGADDLEEDFEKDYFGTEMYWSHYDEATNRRLMRDVGFQELWSELVPDALFGEGKHLFVLAEKGYA